MKTSPIRPAQIAFEPDGTPFSPAFGDVYHARAGAAAQARQVFIAGNGLPERWQTQPRFTVLETGFGLGHNFLATWQAWREDERRCDLLTYVGIEKHPLTADDLRRAHFNPAAAGCQTGHDPALAAQLVDHWPVLAPGIHTLEWEGGRVRLLLALGDVADVLPELVATVDAFYLDGFAPARNPAMWQPRLFKSFARLAAPGATAATWSVAREVRAGLASAGFAVERAPGFAAKREMSVARCIRHSAAPPGRRSQTAARRVIVVGAGLAAAAAARALARDGLTVTVLERHASAALEASGNHAGILHGVWHANDGAHAQLLRAGALRMQQVLAALADDAAFGAAVPLQLGGLLRGVQPAAPGSPVPQPDLPAGYVRLLRRQAAEELAATALAGDQWLYPGGGWVSPGALARHLLAGPGIALRTGAAVQRLHNAGTPQRPRWQALDANGALLAEADVAVVANAHDAIGLLAPLTDAAAWPLISQRGQVTCIPPDLARGLPRPRLPLASGGYLIALPGALGGGLLCGATSQTADADPAVRAADHAHNLRQIAALTGQPLDETQIAALARHPHISGKTGWRLAAADRLPVVGPVPVQADGLNGLRQLEQPRHVSRVPGLYVLTALGSRGLTYGLLLGEALAAWISGAPQPLPAGLLDAIDPARFIARAVRQGGSNRPGLP